MLTTLIKKELRAIITGPKFVATFVACSLLLLMSVFIGVQEYSQAVDQYEVSNQLNQEYIEQTTSWRSLSTREHRRPNPLQIFASGLQYDIGRWSDITDVETVHLRNSTYSTDPVFAVFRILDFTMIVQIVFSLFALLFTYNAVNGEKERGTLRLIFSNAIPRTHFIISKTIGAWIGLVVPLLIPILLSLLMVQLMGVRMDSGEWLRVAGLIGVSVMYTSLFVVVGVLVSTLTSRSSVSFLWCLVSWIAFVLIIPRVGVMSAGHIVEVPEEAQIAGLRDGYAKNKWEAFDKDREQRMRDNSTENGDEGLTDDEIWDNLALEDSLGSIVQRDIEQYEASLMEDLNNRRLEQQRIGYALARLSPAATYQFAVMKLAATDQSLKSRYVNSLTDHREEFLKYTKAKADEAGPGGAVMISVDSEHGVQITSNRGNSGIDASDMPQYTPPQFDAAGVVPSVAKDTAIIIVIILLAFAGSFVSFLRYDVR